jgi:hypothetical protein
MCAIREVIVVGALSLLVASCSDTKNPSPISPTPAPMAPPTSVPPVPIPQVSGQAYDTAYRPVADARIEVLDGAQAGVFTTTDATRADSRSRVCSTTA